MEEGEAVDLDGLDEVPDEGEFLALEQGEAALAARDEHTALLLAGVLRKSARDAAERHRTLRAALAWTHGLLSPPEQPHEPAPPQG